MSKIDATQVSSNWKKLQARLQAEKKDKPAAESNGLKRKRRDDGNVRPGASTKKARVSVNKKSPRDPTRRTMGFITSKPSSQPTSHSTLTKDHDIPASDLAAAYGPSASNPKIPDSSSDEVNGGLHPTHKPGRYIALDCEMVGTGPPPHTDNLLARVSLVNFHGEQIYDSYVLPPPKARVEDYRTHVSGIRAEHLRPGFARTFAEVQKDVADLLDGKVLVGHALRNDLAVLLLSHPKRDIRDTSRYAKYREQSGGRAPALRRLAETELGMVIQKGEHSSVEDARAAMGLFRREKAGFEEEVRRRFGTTRSRAVGKVEKVVATKGVDDVEENDGEDVESWDEDEELDLEGEEQVVAKGGPAPVKKKRKKKKRTKRK
jgi:RNA exonuclease 4